MNELCESQNAGSSVAPVNRPSCAVHRPAMPPTTMATAMSASDYLVAALAEQGVTHVFMVPGGYVDNIAHSIAQHAVVRPVVAATEAGAAMMADGFARVSAAFGACMSISGPGATNMVTALSLATADRSPVLAIVGEPPLAWRDRDTIQDGGRMGLGSIEVLARVSVAHYECLQAAIMPNYWQRAVSALSGPVTGAVTLSMPMDQQATPVHVNAGAGQNAVARREPVARVADHVALDRMLEALKTTPRVVMLIGAGVRQSAAWTSLLQFAETVQIPVATTMSAKGDFPEDHPLSLGVFGWAGSLLANRVLMQTPLDAVLVVGSKLGQVATMGWHAQLQANRQLWHIDIDSGHFHRTYPADLTACSDARAAFDYLRAGLPAAPTESQAAHHVQAERAEWLQALLEDARPRYEPIPVTETDAPIHPGAALAVLSSLATADAQIFVDNGAHTFFAAHYWQSTQPNRFFNAIHYSGAMGWSIPASIGAKVAHPERQTFAIFGDGCMLMQGLEIQTAARQDLSGIIFVLINNGAHGNPKLRAQHRDAATSAITDLPQHDWAGLARALGLRGYRVTRQSALESTLRTALAEPTPVLIDIRCGLYETPTRMFDQTFMASFKAHQHT